MIEKKLAIQKKPNSSILQTLQSLEDCLVPTCSATESKLQEIWKHNFVPRQLASDDRSFVCYMVRCRRKQLLDYIQQLLSSGSPSVITHIINCIEAHYVVFESSGAPSRIRWKKYKEKVTAKDIGLQFQKVKLNLQDSSDLPAVRDKLEQVSNR